MAKRRSPRNSRDTALPSPPKRPLAVTAPEEPEALVVTHWFDPGDAGDPYEATVRVSGRRAGVSGVPGPADSFERDEATVLIKPGGGPISISTRVYGLTPGEWSVTATLVRPRADARGRRMVDAARPETVRLQTASWSWRRWALVPGPTTAVVKTRWALLAPIARIPAVMPGTVPAFVTLGAILALAVLSAHIGQHGMAFGSALLVTFVASVAGLVGAKLWYARLHPGHRILSTGWAVDGFVVAAPIAAMAALLVLQLPVGAYLDDVTPSLFLAVAVGRVGCFFTGCCAGRLTTSGLGVWCSDQRIGARRVPTQLLESAAGLTIGLITLFFVLFTGLVGTGAVFIAGFAAYLLVRTLLLRLRAERRVFLWQRANAVGQTS